MLNTVSPSQTERNWAALVHLSAWLTVLVGAHTGGAGAVLALLVPLGIYLYFRQRSNYVAFHALQATVFQAVGAIALVVAALAAGAGIAGMWVVTGVLSFVLVGLLLLPLALGLTLALLFDLLALAAALLVYPVCGAWRAYHGEAFEYPGVGKLTLRAMGLNQMPNG